MFDWDLQALIISMGPKKKVKYLLAIQEWSAHTVHPLNGVQKLYGKLLHICLVVPSGHTYLTELETMLSVSSTNPFMSYYPPSSLHDDLSWWQHILSRSTLA